MKAWEVGDLVHIASPSYGHGWRVYRIDAIDWLDSRASLQELTGRTHWVPLSRLVSATEGAR